jgi:hypothetical protein
VKAAGFGHHAGMTKLRTAALVAALVLGTAACGGDTPAPTNAAESDEQGKPGRSPGLTEQKKSSKKGGDAGKVAAGGSKGASSTKSSATTEGGEDDSSSAWYPQRGIYTYDQSGFEEFCDASSCEKQDLPPTQDVKASYKSRSSGEVVVVTEARASDSRFVRTTTRHTAQGAFVTDVYLKFDYEGVSFNNSYQPRPPVETLRLPLRAGMRWAGEWEDKTSGNYQIRVGEKEAVSVGGRSVQAFRLHTVTHFRGEFDGSAIVTVWIDPATLAPVKTMGNLDVKSFFGEYRSEFSATLSSAPGYR